MNTIKGRLPDGTEVGFLTCTSCGKDAFEDVSFVTFRPKNYSVFNQEYEKVIHRDLWACCNCGTVLRPPENKRRNEIPFMK